LIELVQDFQDLLIELADAEAEFVVVGGYAVAYHGHVRATKDLDILVRANPENAQRVYRALAEFGAPLQNFDVKVEDFSTYAGVLQIGLPPRRIDIINRASGITFDEACSEGQAFELEGRRVPVIGLRALIKNKRAAGRDQDLVDSKVLSESGGRRGPRVEPFEEDQ
jgi:hypothetical protein